MGPIPKLGRSPGEEHAKTFQYCLENPMYRESWWVTVHKVAESRMTEATKHTGTHTLTHLILITSLGHGY